MVERSVVHILHFHVKKYIMYSSKVHANMQKSKRKRKIRTKRINEFVVK